MKAYLLLNGYSIDYLCNDPLKLSLPSGIIFSDLPLSAIKRASTVKVLLRKYREIITNRIRYKTNILSKAVDRFGGGEKWILLLWESPAVYPENYIKENHQCFDVILTQDDDLVDDVKYFKLYQPVSVPGVTVRPKTFSNKKLAVMINSNKNSDICGELYSARRTTVLEFDKYAPGDLDVYGSGWESYPSGKGKVRDKMEPFPNYRFTICYENSSVGVGYITEKIFDCLIGGTVPVYWGAPNITQHIPDDIFIDRRKFVDDLSLINFLKGVDEKQYNHYIQRASAYMLSDDFYKWTTDNFCKTVHCALK